jgi:dihydroorotase-like cyclic amidohydrolase
VRVSDLLVRNARLVRLVPGGSDEADGRVDVLVLGGRVAEVGTTLGGRPGVEEHDAAGRWMRPRAS